MLYWGLGGACLLTERYPANQNRHKGENVKHIYVSLIVMDRWTNRESETSSSDKTLTLKMGHCMFKSVVLLSNMD